LDDRADWNHAVTTLSSYGHLDADEFEPDALMVNQQ
jgi:hypothetical protein